MNKIVEKDGKSYLVRGDKAFQIKKGTEKAPVIECDREETTKNGKPHVIIKPKFFKVVSLINK